MKIAIIGVTGSVGKEMLNCIDKLKIKFTELKLYASENSKNKIIKFMSKDYKLKTVNSETFNDLDVALFAIDSDLSKKYYEYAKNSKCLIIDNSSAFRMNPNIPLVIPEINYHMINENTKLIANPNCSTILLLLSLSKIYEKYGINRIIVSTYQAASGAGIKGMNELNNQYKEFSNGNIKSTKEFGRQYVNNIFSHNSAIDLDNGYNQEELKMINETKKILNNNKINISATCIRVPVLRAHCESINITLDRKASYENFISCLSSTKGIELVDDRINNKFPEPIDASNKFDVLVGRVRKDLGQTEDLGYELFISGDQILKGAALNAVQILKYVKDNLNV